jgi:hypothetical protein
MVEPWYYPYSRAQVVLPLLVPVPFRAVDLDIENKAYELTARGTFQRAAWQARSSGPASALAAGAGACDVQVMGDLVCLSSETTRCRSYWPVPPRPPDATLFAVRSQGATDACIVVSPSEDSQSGVDGWPRCSPRGAAPWTWFREREHLSASELNVTLSPSTRLCLERWAWGRLDEQP